MIRTQFRIVLFTDSRIVNLWFTYEIITVKENIVIKKV